MAFAVPDPWRTKGPWIKLLHGLWGETWVAKPGLGARIQSETEERVQLDREQLERLDEIEENDRIIIRGSAGTGKTLLAVEAALPIIGMAFVIPIALSALIYKETLTSFRIAGIAMTIVSVVLLRL